MFPALLITTTLMTCTHYTTTLHYHAVTCHLTACITDNISLETEVTPLHTKE